VQTFIACVFFMATGHLPMPAPQGFMAAECTVVARMEEQPKRKTEMPAAVAVLLGCLGKRLDNPSVRELILRLNRGAEPVVRTEGDAFIGESRICFLAAAGVILYSSDHSGTGQRIGQVTLAGRAWKVYEQGREWGVAAFRGSLPLSLKWGQTRGEILKRLGQPALSNEGISISDRPKTPIREKRDADEYQQGNVIIRLIYADTLDGPGGLEEIDLQRTTGSE
jgi:hypothetical protein